MKNSAIFDWFSMVFRKNGFRFAEFCGFWWGALAGKLQGGGEMGWEGRGEKVVGLRMVGMMLGKTKQHN